MNTFTDITNHCSPYMLNWYPVTRKGPTGPGHTTEEILFDKGEDNKKEADWEGHEIKSCGKPIASRIRLATKSAGTELMLHERFGKIGRDGSKRFYPTFRTKVREKPKVNRLGGQVVDLTLDSKAFRITMGNDLMAEWSHADLEGIVTNKINNLLIVGYVLDKGTWPSISFRNLRSYRGLLMERFLWGIKEGHVGVEFRVSQKDDKIHDHGTAFFCSEKTLEKLYWNCDREDY